MYLMLALQQKATVSTTCVVSVNSSAPSTGPKKALEARSYVLMLSVILDTSASLAPTPPSPKPSSAPADFISF